MPIVYDSHHKIFFLHTPRTTYALGIGPQKSLIHLHWGARIGEGNLWAATPRWEAAFCPNFEPKDRTYSFDLLPAEYPVYGRSDFRSPAATAVFPDGSRVFDLFYKTHRITSGKPKLKGLPATYVERSAEASTLEIDLLDAKSGLVATLSYTVYEKRDALTRSVSFRNGGKESLVLDRVFSASVDFPHANLDFLQLSGAWARERDVIRQPLRSGIQSVESRRGASSHQQNPFIALLDPKADERQGEVYGLSLVYSGNFLAQAEVDQMGTTRVQIGINPFDFSWKIEPGASFQAPETVLVYSAEGLDGMSQTYHSLYRERLARGAWRDKERPVLVNNWEATYFDFTATKLEALARESKKLGVELLVLDDGWFGKRNDDTTSLGDWVVDRKKLPKGLADLSARIHKIGLKFGLWFEPEMISPDSDLYRAHPDWCLHAPGRSRTTGRNQLVLDYSRPEICDWIVKTMGAVLSEAKIDYVKWDMNRHLTEIGSATLPADRQKETAHRHILGVYGVMERLTRKFPKVLFEGCSGGGGRFDPGILHYLPQTWASDNSDAISRLRIQYGTTLVYPVSSMTAHVSAVPNHQVHRLTPLKTRGDVAMAGNFGYELDFGNLSAEEKKEVAAQVAFYKRHRKLIQFGRFHRLASPFEGNSTAWAVVSPDGGEALVWNIDVLHPANPGHRRLRVAGLDPKRTYRVVGTKHTFGGDLLRNVGLLVPLQKHDFQSTVWELKAV
ncbi:alpha-galactosidase [Verrucomicrobium sp. GAS474]|uniref:alpha-galactosidase n=1 Tax=Verrucomicrobium sp. GAS474 TaxID=1882831 RepID=UPI00087C800F|nr:alpha-galactosidase [Verrucomicrobium sp. GAS474]SDU05812.1 alpha-galactosidase [Verrucomicrobium sp. GAS474]